MRSTLMLILLTNVAVVLRTTLYVHFTGKSDATNHAQHSVYMARIHLGDARKVVDPIYMRCEVIWSSSSWTSEYTAGWGTAAGLL